MLPNYEVVEYLEKILKRKVDDQGEEKKGFVESVFSILEQNETK